MPLTKVPGYRTSAPPVAVDPGYVSAAAQAARNYQTQLAASQGGATPWTTSQVGTAVESDPNWIRAMGTSRNALVQSRDQLHSIINNAILKGGWDLRGKLGEYGSDVDPATLAAAAANPSSQKAVLQRSLEKGMTDLQYNLAARGMLRSGALPAGSSGLQQSYQEQSDKAMADLVDALQGGIGSYTQFQIQQQQMLDDLRRQIATSITNDPNNVNPAPARPSIAEVADTAKANTPAGMPAWQAALLARSAALNAQHGIGY